MSTTPASAVDIPAELVGAWNGGPGDSAEYDILIADGTYQWSGPGISQSGQFVVQGSDLLLQPEQQPAVTLGWQLDASTGLEILHLYSGGGESSYVRG